MERYELNRMFDQLAPTPEQEEEGLRRLLQTERKVSPMKKLKKMTVACIAAALMIVTCAAAVVTGIDQRILGYFNIASDQEPMMTPTAVRVEKSHTYDNGWTVEVQQAMSDRYSMAVLFDVIAPEGMSLKGEESSLAVQPDTAKDYAGVGWRVDYLADEDAEDNRASYLLFLHYDSHEAYDIIGSAWDLTPKSFLCVERNGTSREVDFGDWTCTVSLSNQDPGLLYKVEQPISLKGCETDLDQVYISPISFVFRLENIPDDLWDVGSDLGRGDLKDSIFLNTASGETVKMGNLLMGGLTNPFIFEPDEAYGFYQFSLQQVIDPAEIASVTIYDQTFVLK